MRPELLNDGVESLGPLLVVGLVGRHHGSLRPDGRKFLLDFRTKRLFPQTSVIDPNSLFTH